MERPAVVDLRRNVERCRVSFGQPPFCSPLLIEFHCLVHPPDPFVVPFVAKYPKPVKAQPEPPPTISLSVSITGPSLYALFSSPPFRYQARRDNLAIPHARTIESDHIPIKNS